jgi:RimJ/RimL family protein N-acetyltransferase
MSDDLVLETDRLILRKFKLDDVDDLCDGLNNLNVSKWLASVPYPYTKECAINYIMDSINNNLYNFAIVLKSENKVIGSTQLTNINYMHGTAGGGIWINEKYHGYGYGTEAFGARIKFAFEVLGLRRLENGYFKNNISSFKMQEKFGYKNEGIRRKRFKSMATGNYEDEYITGLLREEWIDYNRNGDLI